MAIDEPMPEIEMGQEMGQMPQDFSQESYEDSIDRYEMRPMPIDYSCAFQNPPDQQPSSE
jgi:hypothetical protein